VVVVKKKIPTQNVKLYAFSVFITLLVTRIFLHLSPNTNLNLGSINIHHLYIGCILLIISFILFVNQIGHKYNYIMAGVGTALILDELVYLIATDGSDLSYLSATSVIGMFITVIIFFILMVGVYYGKSYAKSFRKN